MPERAIRSEGPESEKSAEVVLALERVRGEGPNGGENYTSMSFFWSPIDWKSERKSDGI